MAASFVPIGRIVGAHGLKGELKVDPLTAFPERFCAGARLRVKGQWVEIEAVRWHKDRPLVKLAGVDSMSDAEALKWEVIEGAAEDRPELEENEYLTEDLIGMSVTTVDGEELGQVDDVLMMPAHDVLQVGDLLIPAVQQFVRSVDPDSRRITVELIEGMR